MNILKKNLKKIIACMAVLAFMMVLVLTTLPSKAMAGAPTTSTKQTLGYVKVNIINKKLDGTNGSMSSIMLRVRKSGTSGSNYCVGGWKWGNNSHNIQIYGAYDKDYGYGSNYVASKSPTKSWIDLDSGENCVENIQSVYNSSYLDVRIKITVPAYYKYVDAASSYTSIWGSTAGPVFSNVTGSQYNKGNLPTTAPTTSTVYERCIHINLKDIGLLANDSGTYYDGSEKDVLYKTFYLTPETYTVTYNKNGGTAASSATTSATQIKGQSVTLPSTGYTRTGYTFNGWKIGSTTYAKGATYTGTANATAYAQWTATTFTVKYDANGGTGAPADQTKTYGTNLTLSSTIPTKKGYEFVNWLCSGDSKNYNAGATFSYNQVGGSVTMKANWEATTYTVSYNANGGTGTMADQTGTYDQAMELSANEFARPTYTFLGWSTDPDAATATYTDKQSVTNLTEPLGTIKLYAVWKKTDASFDTSTLIHDENMFTGDGKLVGGAGTTYDKNNVDSKYAHVDGPNDPGYFTRR